MRTHPDMSLLIKNPLQDVNRLVLTCAFLAVWQITYACYTEFQGLYNTRQ